MTSPAARTVDATAADHQLSTRRLNLMRCGYAFIGVGLAIVKWPILVQNVSALPLFRCSRGRGLPADGHVAAGVPRAQIPRRDAADPAVRGDLEGHLDCRGRPPHLVADDLNAATREVLINCSLVVIIVAVIPWRYAWKRYAQAPGDPWR